MISGAAGACLGKKNEVQLHRQLGQLLQLDAATMAAQPQPEPPPEPPPEPEPPPPPPRTPPRRKTSGGAEVEAEAADRRTLRGSGRYSESKVFM